MSTDTLPAIAPKRAEEIVTSWLRGAPVDGWESPAGPRFSSGEFAAQEITMTGKPNTRCSLCTWSGTWTVCC